MRQFLLLLLMTSGLPAQDLGGAWTSSNGDSISLWTSRKRLQISIRELSGRNSTVDGSWDQYPYAFHYQLGGLAYQARSRYQNSIEVTAPGRVSQSWWRTQPTASSRNVTGTYRSSSGASIQLTSQGRQIFVVTIDTKGIRRSGAGRWLNDRQFDYSIPGTVEGVVATVEPNRITVLFRNGARATWTRI
jgi:hypothetical protein